MRLILAVSEDGFLARGPEDDMSWTGKWDKQAFRLLTHVGGKLWAGRTTYAQLPRLPGREVGMLSKSGPNRLCWVAADNPNSWLIGGPTVAEVAVRERFISEAFLMEVPVKLFQGISGQPLFDEMASAGMELANRFQLGDTKVQVYRG